MSELGKPFLKKLDQKFKKKTKSMSKCRMLIKKPLTRKINLAQTKKLSLE